MTDFVNVDVVVRPVCETDIDGLLLLAQNAGHGMTNLPAVRSLLAEKVARSIESFAKAVTEPDNEVYFFVMEDLRTGAIVGTSGIIAQAGSDQPFYNYKKTREVRVSESLNMTRKNHILHMVNDYQFLSEIGMLFLQPKFRHHHHGLLLSHFRFLYIGEHKQRFSKRIIAEMRGVIDDEGNSPFWSAVGQKFIDLPFSKVDALTASGEKKFIAELMPRSAIHVPLLPQSAQDVMGVPHPQTAPAVALLEKEGFEFNKYIDIFDAGPVLELSVQFSRTINESKVVKLSNTLPQISDKTHIIASVAQDFRACLGPIIMHEDDTAVTTDAVAQALGVSIGDTLRCVAIE